MSPKFHPPMSRVLALFNSLHAGHAESGVGPLATDCQGRYGSDGVVVVHPARQSFSPVSERDEQCLVQQFIA